MRMIDSEFESACQPDHGPIDMRAASPPGNDDEDQRWCGLEEKND